LKRLITILAISIPATVLAQAPWEFSGVGPTPPATPLEGQPDPGLAFWDFRWPGQVAPSPCVPFLPRDRDDSQGNQGAAWDLLIHNSPPEEFEPRYLSGPAHHGPDCRNADPPPEHIISTFEDTIFQCNNHLMTFSNSGGYAEALLTPDRMVDFSNGAQLTWQLSTWRNNDRDWWDVSITPWDENNVGHAIDVTSFDGQGCSAYPGGGVDLMTSVPADMLHLALSGNNSLHFQVIGSDQAAPFCFRLNQGGWPRLDILTPPSAVTRLKFEVTLSTTFFSAAVYYQNDNPQPPDVPGACDVGSLNFCRATLLTQTFNPPLPWTRGIVQFGHHAYDPAKAEGGIPVRCNPRSGPVCKPNTWHWDHVTIDPAVPFTIIQGSQRFVNAQTSDVVTFTRPAPANAFLRFEALSDWLFGVQYSLDGGATWNSATRQAQSPRIRRDAFMPFESYWTPIPEGTQSIQFSARNGWGGGMPWGIRDITIWAQSQSEVAPQNR